MSEQAVAESPNLWLQAWELAMGQSQVGATLLEYRSRIIIFLRSKHAQALLCPDLLWPSARVFGSAWEFRACESVSLFRVPVKPQGPDARKLWALQ